jgi:hypothetical protein
MAVAVGGKMTAVGGKMTAVGLLTQLDLEKAI